MLNTIINGDCLEVMKKIPDKSIDMILCDLPYGTTSCHWDTVIPFEPLWEQYKRIIKDNSAIVLTASQPFTTLLINSNIEWFKYEWIWIKNSTIGFVHAKNQPMKMHENIVVFSKAPMGHASLLKEKRMKYYPINAKNNGIKIVQKKPETIGPRTNQDGRAYYAQTNFSRSCIKFDSDIKNMPLHPTQKPVALFEYLIRTYTNNNDTVLDNCIGSGTTAIACINSGRNFIGIEKDLKYYNIACKRVKESKKEYDMIMKNIYGK